MTPDALVDHLEATHHAYLHAELPRLSALAEKVTAAHGTRHPELAGIKRAYETIRADLEPHLAKEERILFPMIRELATASTAPRFHCGSLQNPISVMLREHDQVGELLATLRRLTDGYRRRPTGAPATTPCSTASPSSKTTPTSTSTRRTTSSSRRSSPSSTSAPPRHGEPDRRSRRRRWRATYARPDAEGRHHE